MASRIAAGRGRLSLPGSGFSLSVVAGLVAAAVGCDIAIPSADFDPYPTLQRLDEVRAPLDTDGDFLLGLDLAVATLEYYGSADLARAISLRPGQREGLLASLRRDLTREALRSAASPAQSPAGGDLSAFTLPWGIIGETLEWDPFDGYVVSGRTGAPRNGVRILLYRMDRQSGYPLRPLTQIGYLDLTDEDGSVAEAVRVRALATAGPDRVIADYMVSLTGSWTYQEGHMQVVTRGAIGEVGSVDLDLRQHLSWSRSRNRDELRLRYTYRRGTRSVGLTGLAESRYDALEWDTFDFALAFRGGDVSTDIDARVAWDGSLTGQILSNGRPVVRVGGYDGRPEFDWSDRRGMTAEERWTLEEIWTGITDLIQRTDWVVIPADLLVASG